MGSRLYLIYIFLLFSFQAFNQACFVENIKMPDGSIRSIPLVLSGSNSNLSLDKVCKVNIRLKHESINQIRIRLVSPSGQSVLLLGPGNSQSNTIFPSPTYNLSFIRCDSVPVPEPGYDARWRNDQTWIGNTFTGTYHPNTGCLTDFNAGPINGTWQLEIEDVVRFDEGTIECFSIEFCNSKNVVSASCDNRKGRLTSNNYEICEYDSLRLLPLTEFPQNRPSQATYTNRYVIMSGTEIIRYTSDTVKNLLPGNYTICQFLIVNSDIPRLPPAGSLISNADFAGEFARLNLCGGVSESCAALIVKPIPQTLEPPPFSICRGGNLLFKGIQITMPGQYNIYVPSSSAGICDTLYKITVNETSLNPVVTASTTEIPCSGEVTLSSATQNITANAVFTFSGPGITTFAVSSATANLPGRYIMIIEDRGCTDSTSITLLPDTRTPNIQFASDTITCARLNSTIGILSSRGPIQNTVWSRGQNLTASSVTTNQPGKILVTITHTDGCTVTDSTNVNIDTSRIKPVIILSEDNLTCRIRNITTTIQNSPLFTPDFTFKRDDIPVSNISNITGAGRYLVAASSSKNGCRDSASVEIRDFQERPNVSLETYCDDGNRTRLRANVSSQFDINRQPQILSWTFPAGQTGNPTSLDQSISLSGTYSLSYTSLGGCRAPDTSIIVNINALYPEFKVNDDSLACDRKNINLTPASVNTQAQYTWTGPNGFAANIPNPAVSTIGRYFGTARLANGCISRDTVDIGLKLSEIPFNLTSVLNVKCEDTLQLQPVDKTKFQYNWNKSASPPIIKDVNDTLYTINSGTYILDISQAGSLCYTIPITVGDERDFPVITPETVNITCDPNILSRITLRADDPSKIDSIKWAGPNGFTSSNNSISNLPAGRYHYVITTKNGCNLRDTFDILNNNEAPRITLSKDSIVLNCDNYSGVKNEIVSVTSLDPVAVYSWTRQGDANVVSSDKDLNITRDGIYTVRVTGENRCINSLIVQVVNDTINTGLVRIDAPPVTCQTPRPLVIPNHINGFRSVNVFFGGQLLTSNINSFFVEKGGLYTLEGIDNRGCRSRDTFTVRDLTDSVRFTSSVFPVGCEAGSINISISNPYNNIKWSSAVSDSIGKDTIQLVSAAGNYSVLVRSPLGCITTRDFQVTVDSARPQALRLIRNEITCSNRSSNIEIDFNRPLKNVMWSHSSGDTITATGQLSVEEGGVYKWVATGNNGCITMDSFIVALDTLKPVITFDSDTLTCSKPITFIRTSYNTPVDQYLWEGPQNFTSRDSLIRVGIPGKYRLTVKSPKDCQTTDSIVVLENKVFPKLSLPDSLNLPCTNDSLMVNFQSDQPIRDQRWVHDRTLLSRNPVLVTRTSGRIRIFAVSVEGCQTEDSLFVFVDTVRTRANPAGNNITCDPDTSFLRGNINSPYISMKWLTPSGTEFLNSPNIKSQDSGRYLMIVERIPLCQDTFVVNISADRVKPTLNVTQRNPIKCEVREAVLEGQAAHFRSNSLIYSWSTGRGNIIGPTNSRAIRVNANGSYVFRAVDTVNNCAEFQAIQIEEEISDLGSFTLTKTDPVCFAANDGRINIGSVTGGTRPYGISLSSTSPFIRDSVIRNLRAGVYTVYLRDSFGCVKNETITLNDGQKTFVRLPGDTTITLGAAVDIDFISDVTNQNIRDIIWMAENGENCDGCRTYKASLKESTRLTLVVTNTSGCVAIDSMNINVLPIINWVFPNILSVSSTTNSLFSLPENEGVELVNNVAIYDRWGNIVWQASNFKPGDSAFVFDASDSNLKIESGVFVIKIEATLINGLKWNRVKDFTIIK